MKHKILYLILITILITSNQLKAQLPIIKSDADSLIQLGKDYVYNVEFIKAGQCFKEVIKRYPAHPAGYFLDAMIEWWKINLYRRTEKNDNLFLKKIEKVIEVCDAELRTDPSDVKSLFFKAGAMGFRGRYYAMRKSWFPAINDGSNAYNILIDLLKIAPQNYDIMLGTGLYCYLAAVLPEKYSILKPMLYFLPEGNRELGLSLLKASGKNALYANVESKVALLNFYYDFEGNANEAIKIAKELNERYPKNPYFKRYLGRCYVSLGDLAKYESTWRELLVDYIQGKEGYDEYSAREALYYVGYALMSRGEYDMALKYFLKCNDANKLLDKEPTGFQTKTLLKIGNIYDIKKRRTDAEGYYKKILALKDVSNSHAEAEKYLKTPFKK